MSELVPELISTEVLLDLIFSANAPVLCEFQLSYALSVIFDKSLIVPVILGPNIIGGFDQRSTDAAGGTGCISVSNQANPAYRLALSTSARVLDVIDFNASRSSSIYSSSTTVQPNSLVFNYIIKY